MTSNDDIAEMYTSIVKARGGLSGEQEAIARALAIALCADPIAPATVTALTNLLPPPLNSMASGVTLDLTKLTDDELAECEQMRERLDALMARCGAVSPDAAAEANAAASAEIIENSRRLIEDIALARDQKRIAEQEAATERRLGDGARARCAELAQQLADVRSAVARGVSDQPGAQTAHGRVSLGAGGGIAELPANVLPLDPRGNGSAVVNGDLHDRYPFLGYVDPIA
jgi:hypothetical protein